MPANYPAGGQVDFQVQAMIGYLQSTPSLSLPLGDYEFIGQASGWSSTQTVTIPASSDSSSPSLTATPTSTPAVPELSWLVIVPLLLCVLFFALVLRHRKTANFNR